MLSAMLLDAEAVTRAVELVDETMFYREGHRRIFKAALTLHQNGAVVDPVTLAEELERQGALQAAGGREYIGVLLYAVPTAANVEYHAKIVKEKALRRRLIDVAQGLVQEAHESPSDANELIDLAEHRIFQVSQQRGGEGFTRIKELLWPAMERIEQLREGGPLTGVPSGFVDLDNKPIELMFKLYPWEWMMREKFGASLPGAATQFVEPPWKAILSNKGILPILWEMFPNHPNLLPAYFDDDPRIAGLGNSYVRKPLYSREGANVDLVVRGASIDSDPGPYGAEGFVRQAVAAVPQFDGNYTVLGSWIAAGEPCGLSVREDASPITASPSAMSFDGSSVPRSAAPTEKPARS